jgi:hypothetical protein
LLDNFLLYTSLKEIDSNYLKGIQNQANIKKRFGSQRLIPNMAGIWAARVQPEGRKPGHTIGLQMNRVR